MFKFLKGSIREFKHIVWPTYNETKKYFLIVIVLLSMFGIYLFIANTVISEVLYGIKDVVSVSNEPNISIGDIEVMSGETKIVETNEVKEVTLTGSDTE